MKPEFLNTPANTGRPDYGYRQGGISDPLVSVITVYYNASAVFWEAVRSVLRMSCVDWEWLIIDDGSDSPESLGQLERVTKLDARIRVLRQSHAGLAAGLNRAAHEAQGDYLLRIDPDELVEPTFVEKAVWLLETQPQFAFCNSWSVGCDTQAFLWREGFERRADFLNRTWVQPCAVIRRDAYLSIEGYDEHAQAGLEDWTFWLRMALNGFWGYTLHEYLLWTRRPIESPLPEMTKEQREQFTVQWQAAYGNLLINFPARVWFKQAPYTDLITALPFTNRIQRKPNETRVLLILDSLDMGGGNRFVLDLIRIMSQRGYRFTVVTTKPSEQQWYEEFTMLTPDVFCLDIFINMADYPRFLSYLVESRGLDTILIANSEAGYLLVPYLQAMYPELAFLDFNNIDQSDWNQGGYPAMSARIRPPLDRNIVSSNYLRRWMLEHGVDAERLMVIRTNADVDHWNLARFERPELRSALGVVDETPIILYVGQINSRKRPFLFASIIKRLAEERLNFFALVVGDGEELPKLQAMFKGSAAAAKIGFTGMVTPIRVQELMAAGDILLLPSAHEGIAATLYEAMSMELIPVAADVGGNSELVTPDTGVLIPLSDDEVNNYVDALKALLADPLKRNIQKKRARKRIMDSFNFQTSAELMDKAIRDVRTQTMHRMQSPVAPDLAHYMAHLAVEALRKDQKWQSAADPEARYTPTEVQNSRSWRFAWGAVTTWWAVKLRLMPLGSKRLKTYENFVKRFNKK
ncbi:MAG: glycosyltransferase [Anaerolineae bacterium]|nr:glycosyltransferase [Anaerolineae bacterium]